MSEPARDSLTISGHVSAEDKARDDYRLLPFEMPDGTQRVDVSYEHTRTNFGTDGQNILDIGIFSPGPDGENPGEFRGWSGGARTSFHVATDDATPGYLPGPMPAGKWHVILGLYRIGEAGCNYTVRVRFSPGSGRTVAGDARGASVDVASSPGRPAPTTPAPADPASAGPTRRWYVGDLQSHTHHSDAKATVEEIARVARARGLDFLAVTDHNTISHHPELPRHSSGDLLLMPSMELTTYYGHANIWGLRRWVDFRCREARDLPPRITDAHEQSALFSVNHPISDCPWTFGWIDGIDSIEIWQGLWNRGNLQAVAWWDELLCRGLRITGVGGSDRHQPAEFDPHFPHQVGTPATRVLADRLSTDDILEAIRRGRVVIAAAPKGPWMDLEVSREDGTTAGVGDLIDAEPDEELRVKCVAIGAVGQTIELVSDGQVVERATCTSDTEHFSFRPGSSDGTYLRAQLLEGSEEESRTADSYPLFLALTNPVYLRPAGNREGGVRHGK